MGAWMKLTDYYSHVRVEMLDKKHGRTT